MLLQQKIIEMSEQWGGELNFPAGVSAGCLNESTPEAVFAHADLILRWSPSPYVTLGSGTNPAIPGNAIKFADEQTKEPARDFYFDPATGEAVNSIGLKNPGEKDYREVVSQVAKVADRTGKLLLMSVSSSGDEDPSVVLPELAEKMFEAGAHGVEINLGCPNKVEKSGQRHAITGLDPEATEMVIVNTVERVGIDKMLGAKLSYYEKTVENDIEDYHGLITICKTISKLAGIDFVTLTNTEPNVVMTMPDGSYVLDKIPGCAGGGSGPARAEEAYQQLLVARRVLRDSIDIISTTGVFNGEEVLRRQRGGALLSGMVTRLWHGVEHGDSYVDTLKDVYKEYLDARVGEALSENS